MEQKEKYYLNQFFKFLKQSNKYNSFIKIMSNKGINNVNEYYDFILCKKTSKILLDRLLCDVKMFCAWESTNEGYLTWNELHEHWINYTPNIRYINMEL